MAGRTRTRWPFEQSIRAWDLIKFIRQGLDLVEATPGLGSRQRRDIVAVREFIPKTIEVLRGRGLNGSEPSTSAVIRDREGSKRKAVELSRKEWANLGKLIKEVEAAVLELCELLRQNGGRTQDAAILYGLRAAIASTLKSSLDDMLFAQHHDWRMLNQVFYGANDAELED